jgi:DNA-binding transcriptional ArsR family regulator
MVHNVVLDALGDPMRREILARLRRGARPVGELADGLPISRPAVSKHLKVLRAAGLVTVEEQGTRRVYAIDGRGVDDARNYLDSIWDGALADFKRAAERDRAKGAR